MKQIDASIHKISIHKSATVFLTVISANREDSE
jgi:hypothetical protein